MHPGSRLTGHGVTARYVKPLMLLNGKGCRNETETAKYLVENGSIAEWRERREGTGLT